MRKQLTQNKNKRSHTNNKAASLLPAIQIENDKIFKMTQQILKILQNFSRKILNIQNNFEKCTNSFTIVKKTFNDYFKSLQSLQKQINQKKIAKSQKIILSKSQKICRRFTVQNASNKQQQSNSIKQLTQSKRTIKKDNDFSFTAPVKKQKEFLDIVESIYQNDFTCEEIDYFKKTDKDESIYNSRINSNKSYDIFEFKQPVLRTLQQIPQKLPALSKVNSMKESCSNKLMIPLKPQNSVQQLLKKSKALKKRMH